MPESHSASSPVPARWSAPANDRVLSLITGSYQTLEERISLGTRELSILRVADPDALVDALDPLTFARDERLPYWADLWTSSIGLARWFDRSPWIASRTLCELGCGVGLAGIAAACAGARVTMTDYEEDALLFAHHNCRRNLAAPYPALELLDWRAPGDIGRFDIVAGADIAYERDRFWFLLKLFRRLLNPDGVVVLADPGRQIGADFLTCARQDGLRVRTEVIPVERRGILTGVHVHQLSVSDHVPAEMP